MPNDIFNNPRYQKRLSRILRMSPQQRALLTPTLDDLEAGFATEEMRRDLMLMDLAAQKKQQAASLELGRGRLGLAKERFGYERGQQKMANILGLASLPIGAGLGYANLRESDLMARILAGQAKYYE